MKTIGYVLSSFPVFSETFVGTEMRAMMARGHRVVPIVLQRSTAPGQPADAALAAAARHVDTIERVPALRHLARNLPRLPAAVAFAVRQTGIRPRSLTLNAAKVALLARAAGCAHLHAHFAQASTAHAIVAARLAGLTVSFVAHGYDVYRAPTDLEAKLRNVDFAVAVCRPLANDMAALSPRTPIEIVHCGIDPERFVPAPPHEPDNGRWLFIGRLVPQKGIDDLITALATLEPNAAPAVDIVGDGPLGAALRARVAALGLAARVQFLGARDSEWLRQVGPTYRGLVAPFCMDPNGDRDTGPVVLKEAMAMGLPIVSTRFMGVPEIIDDSCGRLVPPKDPVALARALTALDGASPLTRRRLGDAGRRRVIRLFTAHAQAGHLSAAIETAA